jgi:argininosuccinate synthase
MKSRGVYETPGGTILHKAHRAIESVTMDREAMRLRVYRGFWFSPERTAMQSLIDTTQRHVTGEARVKLYKGSVTVVGRKSECSLYDPALATFEEGSGFDPRDATGFIKLHGLRLRLATLQADMARKLERKA